MSAGIGASGPIKPFHQRADDGRSGGARVLFRQMTALDRGRDAALEFGGERLAKIEPHGVDVGVHRLADRGPDEPALLQRARSEGRDALASADSGPGAASPAALTASSSWPATPAINSATRSVLDGK